MELQPDLEDAQRQMEIFQMRAEENREQITQILKLTEGRTSGTEGDEMNEKVNEIASILDEDRKELQGWKVQLALKIAGRPKAFYTKQKKLRYAVGCLK